VSGEPLAEQLELTILMPCLNEAETLATCVDKARGFLERHGVKGEVLVADNGSTDGSQDIAVRHGARVVAVPVRGYGAALFAGSMAARGRYIIMGDADDSYDFTALEPFLEKLRGGAELVMGNRFRGGIFPGAMPWKNRYLGNPVLSGLGRLLFRCPAGDFHCGLRGFTREAFVRMELRTTGMEFASEMVIKATLLGMSVVEVPTTLRPDGRSRPPHLRPWRDGWRHLRFMMLYSPQWLFLYPGLLLMLVGSVAGLALLPGPRFIGSVGFDIHTLLYSAVAVLLGFQGVLFSAFARVFADVEGLAPRSPQLSALFRFFNLERGLIVGGLMLVGGITGSVLTVAEWGRHAFGALNPSQTLRAAIPSVLALSLGGELVLASFFLSMLGLRLRRRETP
jgi:glycosyltransferase involved in cell wall biosynthesis